MIGCRLHGEAITIGCPGCANYIDDLFIAAQVRERLAKSKGDGIPLEEFLRQANIDPKDLA